MLGADDKNEYQNYKSETRIGTVAEYQTALQHALPAWLATINPADYLVWVNTETAVERRSLVDFLTQSSISTQVTLGQVWCFPVAETFDYQVSVTKMIQELIPLYAVVTVGMGDSVNWFYMFYSSTLMVAFIGFT